MGDEGRRDGWGRTLKPPQGLFDPTPNTVTRMEYYEMNGLPCPDRVCGSLPVTDAEIVTSPPEQSTM